MANSTCSITSFADLLDQADKNLLNITTTIAACPEICSLAWGKGNPDLTGIGVNISYIIQGSLTAICGPILGFVYFFRHRFGLEDGTQDRIAELHGSFIDISAAFNIPVGVAAAIRMGDSPIVEQAFFLYLLSMQTTSFLVGVATALVFGNRTKAVIFLRYIVIQFYLWTVVMVLVFMNHTKWRSERELLENCEKYAKLLPTLTFGVVISPVFRYIVWGIVAFDGILVCVMCIRTLWHMDFGKLARVWEGTQNTKQRRFLQIFLAAFITFWTYFMIRMTLKLETTRRNLREITGADFQDDQWGFGQVVAVFFWVPLCFKITRFVILAAIHWVASGCTLIDIWYSSGLGTTAPRWSKVRTSDDR